MKVKTCELSGAALDWAVAMAENWAGADFEVKPYSSDWSQGGPIVERELMDVGTSTHGGWRALLATEPEYTYGEGITPLIAAMRCYVASKLGDEVDVPEELL